MKIAKALVASLVGMALVAGVPIAPPQTVANEAPPAAGSIQQDMDPDFADALRRDLARYEGDFLGMARTRGGWNPPTTVQTGDRFARNLGEGLKRTQLPILSAALFYSQRETDLAIYLVGFDGDRGKLLASAIQPVTLAQMEQAIGALRGRLGVDEPGVTRAPRRRSGTRGHSRASAPATAGGDDPAKLLADMLLPKPIREHFPEFGALQVIGNGLISTVPFAMLPLDDKRMVIDETYVVIASSLYETLVPPPPWQPLAQWPALQQREALFVGDPKVPSSDKWKVDPLDGAVIEARQLSKRMNATPLIGAAATKAAVVERMKASPLIHIAAHGVADPERPLDGGLLMLSGKDEASAFLTAREVQAMKLSARLVVLSACQSGLGRAHQGGMMGLSRAFRIAGVPRIAMTLWSVDDDATLYLMQRFQHYLFEKNGERYSDGLPGLVWEKGTPPAAAMRLAQIDTRKAFGHPRYWAGFTMFGTLN